MMVANAIFVDTNILIYANLSGSPFHTRAQAAIRNQLDAGAELWISRQVMREYMAALTRPQGTGKALPVNVVIQDVRRFEQEFRIAEDGPQVTRKLLELLSQAKVRGNQIHDANIVATMLVHGINNVLTHNISDFRHFTNLITIVTL